MDIKEIQNLIKFVAKSGASEVKLEMEDLKITIKTGSEKTETTIVQAAPMPTMQQMAAPVAPAAAPEAAPVAPAAASNDEDQVHYYKVSNHWYFLQKTFSRQSQLCRSWNRN